MTVRRLEPYAVTIFAEMSALAARIGAVNLGQGFPDEDGPPAMLRLAENAIAEGAEELGLTPEEVTAIGSIRSALRSSRRRVLNA